MIRGISAQRWRAAADRARGAAKIRMSEATNTSESQIVAAFAGYARIIDAAIVTPRADFVPPAESATEVQVDRGVVLARAAKNLAWEPDARLVERLMELAPSQRIGQI